MHAINRHDIYESELLALLVARNPLAYPSLHKHFQMIADSKESPNYTLETDFGYLFNSIRKKVKPYGSSKVLDDKFDCTSQFSLSLLPIMHIDSAIKNYINKFKKPIPHISDIENYIESRLDHRSLKALKSTCSYYKERENARLLVSGKITLDDLKIFTIKKLTTQIGKEFGYTIDTLDLNFPCRISGEEIAMLPGYFPNLTHLSIHCVTEIGLKRLSVLTKLESLHVQECCSFDQLKEHQPDFKFLKKLRFLQNLKVGESTNFKLEFLKYCPSLTSLDISFLSNDRNNVRDLKHIVTYCPNIKNLNLSHCKDLRNIDEIKNLKNLKNLNFRFGCRLNLSPLLKCPSLKDLYLFCDDDISFEMQKKLKKKGVNVIFDKGGNIHNRSKICDIEWFDFDNVGNLWWKNIFSNRFV